MLPDATSDQPVRLPGPVRIVCETFRALLDEQLPGRVEGLYLHGSLGFGEWYDGRSDVDFVAAWSRRPEAEEARRLAALHEQLDEMFPRPSFDGFHCAWDDLARSPYDCPDVPCTLGGVWEDEGRTDVNPVTWHELARHGVTVWGPDLADVAIWTDAEALRAHTLGNLETYWAGEVEALRRFPAEAGKQEVVAWHVLGVARLHHLVATGELTSKNGAGRHALDAFGGRWRLLLTEALSYRATGDRVGVLPPDQLAAEVVEFCELVIDDARRLAAGA